MPDSSIPPTSDDEPDDLSAFDEFVNEHLNFDARPAPPPAPRPARGLFEVSDDDFDEDDDEDPVIPPPTAAPGPPLSSGIFGRNPFVPPPPRPASSTPGPASLPPRIPMPPANDSRWQAGLYSTQGDMEIFYSQPYVAMRVLVIANAHLRLNRKVRFIPNIALGWAAIEIRTSRTLRGFVRQSDVRLWPLQLNSRHWLAAFALKLLREYWSTVLIIVAFVFFLAVLLANPDISPRYAAESTVTGLEAQVATQQAQIEALEARISSTPVPLKDE